MALAYIFDALRSPRGRGKVRGALHEVKPAKLLLSVLNALRERHNLPQSAVEDLLIGCATPVGEQGGNIAKTTLHYGQWDWHIPGLQLNRFCASSLEAIALAAGRIAAGWADLLIAGGLESMSRVPMGSDGSPILYDPAISSKALYVPQGISADLLATLHGLDRDSLDRYALRSHERAQAATQAGHFQRSIIPICDDNGLLLLNQDEYLRPNTSLEDLANLPAAFAHLGELGFDEIALLRYPKLVQIQHLHTAGNSSGIVDGAAAVLLGSAEQGEALGLKPRAIIRSCVSVGSEPTVMLTGGSAAAQKALKKAGLQAQDIDLWEYNEAFAAPALLFQREWQLPDERYNVNGGAIALGHPLGATGAMLLCNLLDELERQDLELGMLVIPIAGGMASAAIIQRCY